MTNNTGTPDDLASKPITPADISAATRGLNLTRRTDEALAELLAIHGDSRLFAGRVIAQAVTIEQQRRAYVRADLGRWED